METTAKSRYDQLEKERRPYFDRAVRNAKLTIPMLFPDEYDNETTDYDTPYQSIGSRGVNNLTAKIMKVLFPPNEPFFRLAVGSDIEEEVETQGGNKVKIDELMALMERKANNYIETQRYRITVHEAVAQLVVAGNACLYAPPDTGGLKMFRLSNYVVSRDGLGKWIELITKESIAYAALPENAKQCIEYDNPEPDKEYDIYTRVYLKDGRYHMYQELEGKTIPDSKNDFPEDKVPWIPLRYRKMDGESYGRSHVDEYYGDLKTCDTLSKAASEMASIAAYVLFLVNPASTLRVDKLKGLPSGSFVKGKEGDIIAFQLNKLNDLNIVTAQLQDLQTRLAYAFLINSAVQRQAERVTAEEIRYVAGELEDTIGSVYSLLSLELQAPLVRCVLAQLMRKGALPDVPQGDKGIQVKIVTGVEALGRGYDLTKVEQFLQLCATLPEAAQRLKTGNVLSIGASSLGLDGTQLVKSDEEVQAEMEQAQAMALAQQMAGPVAGNLTAPQQTPTQGG